MESNQNETELQYQLEEIIRQQWNDSSNRLYGTRDAVMMENSAPNNRDVEQQ